MIQATGQLRYGPEGATLPRRGWWLILVCDRDWYRLYAPKVTQEIRPQVLLAADGSKTAFYRPLVLEPAWRPHISIARNEKPKQYADLWTLGVKVGDLLDVQEHCIESAKYLRAKAEAMRLALADADPSKWKHHDRMEGEIAETLAVAAQRDRQLDRTRNALRDARRRWEDAARAQGFPLECGPGQRVTFACEESPRMDDKHWWFDVRASFLLDLRERFGLPRRPRLPLHLTFAVREGHEDDPG